MNVKVNVTPLHIVTNCHIVQPAYWSAIIYMHLNVQTPRIMYDVTM